MDDELLDALTDAVIDINPAVTWVSDGDRTLVFGDGSMLIMPPGLMQRDGDDLMAPREEAAPDQRNLALASGLADEAIPFRSFATIPGVRAVHPGPWFSASWGGNCSRCWEWFEPGDNIRAGVSGWECCDE